MEKKKNTKNETFETKAIEIAEPDDSYLTVQATPPDMEIRPLIEVALSRDNSIEAVNALLEMRRQLKAEWAREEYYKALSELQTEIRAIPKDKEVKNRDG